MNQAEYRYRAGKLVLMNYDCEQSVTCAIVYRSDRQACPSQSYVFLLALRDWFAGLPV